MKELPSGSVLLWDFVPEMPDMKQFLKLNQQAFSKAFVVLIGKLSIDFKKFGNLLFKFGDALNIELFFFGSQIPRSDHLLWLSLRERGPPLKTTDFLESDM